MTWALITDPRQPPKPWRPCLRTRVSRGWSDSRCWAISSATGADPAWAVEQVQALQAQAAVAVQGNHDAAVAAGERPGMRADARAVVEWGRASSWAAVLAMAGGTAFARA